MHEYLSVYYPIYHVDGDGRRAQPSIPIPWAVALRPGPKLFA